MCIGGGILSGHPGDDAVDAVPVAHEAGKAKDEFAAEAALCLGQGRIWCSGEMRFVDAVGDDDDAVVGHTIGFDVASQDAGDRQNNVSTALGRTFCPACKPG